MATVKLASAPSDKITTPTSPALPSTTIHEVSFNPNDNTQVCIIGSGIFKLYRYSEGTLKPMLFQKLEARVSAREMRADERIAIGTEDSRILICESNGELKHELPFFSDTSTRAVHAIVSFNKGFAAAGASGSLVLFERADDAHHHASAGKDAATAASGEASATGSLAKEPFRRMREYSLQDEATKIVNLAMNPTEDNLLCTSENNQIYCLPVGSAEVKGDESKLETFSQPFHHGQITGMDTCIRKPLIATCSNDKSVRIWNYLDSSNELVKYFSEEAYSVAIHPSGLYILVGFSDKLRLMNLLIDDIRPFREFTIRGCRECRFSNGGQYFAAVHGNTIQIYSTWRFENVGNLKGHNGKVRSIHWSPDDRKIVTAGIDGAIYDWLLKDMNGNTGGGVKREGESILKSCSYTCAVASPDGKSIFAVGSDKTLKEIVDSQIVRELESNQVLIQVALSHSGRMMFVGTASGTIRSMKFPLSNDLDEYQEHLCHSGAVTKLRVSYDDTHLFSASDDGCVYVFRIADKEGRGMKRERETIFADEILVTKSDLEEKNQMMAELKTRVEELKMENEYQLRLKDMNFNEKIKEVTEKFLQEIEALKITSTVLRTDKEKEEVRHEEEMVEERERHSREMLDLETVHNSKLMAEYDKFQALQQSTAELQLQWEVQMRDMQSAKEKALAELTNHFELKLREKQAEIERIQNDMKLQFKEYEETTRETEEDADSEILELKHRYERKLKEEREVGLRLKGENGIMRKKFNTLQAEIDAHKAEIAKMFAEEKKLHSIIKSLEKDIAGLKKEIQERDETIQDKEKRIYDLKKKNQELEKFKFVLDYKIKELKRQIEPREQDIQGMTNQIKEMDTELEHYHKANTDLELQIADLKLKLKAAEKQVVTEHARLKGCCATIKHFKVDLNECVQFIQEPKIMKAQVKKLYQKYCKEAMKDEETLDVDIQQEYSRHREYLEKTVSSLRQKVSKDQGIHRSENVQIMEENAILIKEINQLRKDLRSMRSKEKAAELALRHIVSVTESKEVPMPKRNPDLGINAVVLLAASYGSSLVVLDLLLVRSTSVISKASTFVQNVVARGSDFTPRGRLVPVDKKPWAARYEADSDIDLSSVSRVSNSDEFYTIKAVADNGIEFVSSVRLCLLQKALLKDFITIHYDQTGVPYHMDYTVDANGPCSSSQKPMPSKISFKTKGGFAKSVDGERPRLEQITVEAATGKKEEKTFIQKYWYYFVPVLIILLFSGNEEPKK
ncbi:Cilia- and flagella-associated protein 57 [Entophlyctis luteolus]|nr:Cilia- and flagella-associated protein 57 [Entophlyctis luteolus]